MNYNKDNEAKLAVSYFKTANKSFEFIASYNFSKIKTDDNKKYFFYTIVYTCSLIFTHEYVDHEHCFQMFTQQSYTGSTQIANL